MDLRAIDLFCGAGGSSWGAKAAGATIVAGFDSWQAAGNAYRENFPEARFYHARLECLSPVALRRSIGTIDLLLASPECTNHGPAKGATKRSEESRNTAFEVPRFAEAFEPRWIVIENVSSMRRWGRYKELLGALRELGYNVSPQVLNAGHFGVPQRRRRLFIICDREAKPPLIGHRSPDLLPASKIVDMNGTYPLSPLKKEGRALATLARAHRAIEQLGSKRPFLLVYYGSDRAGGWQRLDTSLRTITTLDRFALVKPTREGHVMRMLQVPELKRAMGMPQTFSLGSGNRRQSIHLIGNAVCPPVMRSVIRDLLRSRPPLVRP